MSETFYSDCVSLRGTGGRLGFLNGFRTTPAPVRKELFDVDLRLVVINDQSKKIKI